MSEIYKELYIIYILYTHLHIMKDWESRPTAVLNVTKRFLKESERISQRNINENMHVFNEHIHIFKQFEIYDRIVCPSG